MVSDSAWALRNEWRKLYNTRQRIRAHIVKVTDGRHTLLSDNGIELLTQESAKIGMRLKEIEAIFKRNRWAL